MKSINHALVIVTIVLGLGTTASASANNSRIEDSLKQVIVKQSQQVSERLTQQLQQSIKIELSDIVLTALPMINRDIKISHIAKEQLVNKNQLTNTTSTVSTTTEEE
ncbi:MAG: hypothetical protein P8I03_05775 [Thalassotalea sp.]|nr:hypothetical protein [Thalassotalea sp.]